MWEGTPVQELELQVLAQGPESTSIPKLQCTPFRTQCSGTYEESRGILKAKKPKVDKTVPSQLHEYSLAALVLKYLPDGVKASVS